MILLRQGQQLILNHVVLAPHAERLTYRASLPVVSEAVMEQDSATREAALTVQGQRVRFLPVSIPQERTGKAAGKLTLEADGFVVEQSAESTGMFVSTLLDWNPQRRSRPVDWSLLTVVQDGKIEPASSAFGVRYRIGRDQWLMYHSLQVPDIPRTVLGMHTLYETSLSRFSSKGEVEPIVEVEVSQ